MDVLIFILCIFNLILLISLLSTLDDVKDSLLDLERDLRFLNRRRKK